MGFILRSVLKAEVMTSSPQRTEAKRNTRTRSLLMGAYSQWLQSGLGFISTAVFQSAYVSYLSKTKGPLCSNVEVESLPQQLPFTFQRPQRGAEQLRFFKGGQWSMETGQANRAFIQVNILYCALSATQTGCFGHEVQVLHLEHLWKRFVRYQQMERWMVLRSFGVPDILSVSPIGSFVFV